MAKVMESHLKEITERIDMLAKSEELTQSLLFIGPGGVGKFRLVMKIASLLLCREKSACGKCPACREVSELRHPDFLLVFPFPKIRPESRKHTVFSFSDPVNSAARYSEETRDEIEQYLSTLLEDPFALINFEKKENIPVEVIKDLIMALAKKPMLGGRRVVAILNVDKMAFGAADLFLKIVEEPPSDTHIVLTTSSPDRLLPTLISRTSVFKIHPAPVKDLASHLRKKLGIDKEEALYLAMISGGSPGKAENLYHNEAAARRDRIFTFFARMIKRENISLLIDDINIEYGNTRLNFNEIKLDFEIMESIVHDLYMLAENNLDNHLINTDIALKLKELPPQEIETLDVWREYCGEVKRACLINNVTVDSGMMFFYISCEKAIDNPVALSMKLP